MYIESSEINKCLKRRPTTSIKSKQHYIANNRRKYDMEISKSSSANWLRASQKEENSSQSERGNSPILAMKLTYCF